MRWKPLEGRELPEWITTPVGVFYVVILGPVIIAHMIEQEKRRRFGPFKEWGRWYAWYPVRSDCGFGHTVWLEWVERRDWYGSTHHRTLEEAAAA